MDKDITAKELKSNPFKIKNKMEKETDIIQKLIDTTTKKVVASELFETLNNEFEKLLLKTKDAIQAHIRATVLGNLGYTDVAKLFNAKAIELGYVVENKKINENNMLSKQEWIKKINTLAPIKIANMKERIRVIEREIGKIGTDYIHNDELYELYQLIISSPFEDDSENEIIENNSNKCKCDENGCVCDKTNEAELHSDNTDIFAKLIAKYPLSEVLSSQLQTVIANYDAGKMQAEFGDKDKEETINAISAIVGDTPENIAALINDVTEETEFQYFGIHVKFSDNGLDPEDPNYETEGYTKYVKVPVDMSGDEDDDVVNYAVDKGLMTMEDGKLSDYVEEVTEEEFNSYTNTVQTPDVNPAGMSHLDENHKQQFEYSPQEETKYKIDEDAPVVKKLDYNPIALKHMISDDPFLKFSYHNLSVGEEETDLELIYNTYIRDEADMMNKLKTYESYRAHIDKQTK